MGCHSVSVLPTRCANSYSRQHLSFVRATRSLAQIASAPAFRDELQCRKVFSKKQQVLSDLDGLMAKMASVIVFRRVLTSVVRAAISKLHQLLLFFDSLLQEQDSDNEKEK